VLHLVGIGFGKNCPISKKDASSDPSALSTKTACRLSACSAKNVDQPSQPEAFAIADTLDAGSGKDFKQANSIPAQESRRKAKTRFRPNTSLIALHPTLWISVQEGVGDHHRYPQRIIKPACLIELSFDALVED
jgi:hypothetical protein